MWREKDAFRNDRLHQIDYIWGFFYSSKKIQYKKTKGSTFYEKFCTKAASYRITEIIQNVENVSMKCSVPETISTYGKEPKLQITCLPYKNCFF